MLRIGTPTRDRHELLRHIERSKRRLRVGALRELERMTDDARHIDKRLEAANIIIYSADQDMVAAMGSVIPPTLKYPSIPGAFDTFIPPDSVGMFRAILGHGDERIDDMTDLFNHLSIPANEVDDLRQTVESNKELIRLEIVKNMILFEEFLDVRNSRMEAAKLRISEAVKLLR
jgi:hypothetical protein